MPVPGGRAIVGRRPIGPRWEGRMALEDAMAEGAPDAVATTEAPVARGSRWRISAIIGRPFSGGLIVTLGVLAGIAIGVAIVNVATVLVSLLLALFLALALDPLVRRLERTGMKRGWGIALVFLGFLIVVLFLVLFVLPRAIAQVIELAQSIPDVMVQVSQTDWFQTATSTLGAQPDAVAGAITDYFSNPQNILALSGGLLSAASGVIGAISSTVVIVVLTLYFLASLEAMKRTFYRFSPAWSRPTVQRLTETITDSMGGFVITMVTLGAINAVLVFLLYFALGLPFPVLMALVAFFLTLIPVIGSVLFWAVGSVVAVFANPVAALIFAIVYLIYMQVEAYVLTPRLMGRTIAVPGILVLIAALIGATLLGLLGALVAIPIVAIITLIVGEVVLPRQDRRLVPDA
jgi:predicted PurR-regulated permease PerM